MMKLKLGDRVVMLETTRYGDEPSNPRGVEGVITGAEGGSYRVKWDNGNSNNSYSDTDIGLVQQELNSTVEASIDSLILLEEVQDAHHKESSNWFKSLLELLSPILAEEWPEFFKAYEEAYKRKTGSTSMPTSYRTSKSVIIKGYEADVRMWKGEVMGKSAIEKATKESRKSKIPPPPEELLGTIIKACDTIEKAMATYGGMTGDFEQYQEARKHIATFGASYRDD